VSSAEGNSADVVRALLRTRRALLADVDHGASARVLVRSDLTGTMQLYELLDGELRSLTALPEPVATADYVPDSRTAVLAIDRGGDERHQLYLLGLDAATDLPGRDLAALDPLTADPRFGHRLAGIAPDGRWIAYLSNRANGVDFDLWICDLATRDHRLCYASGAFCQAASGSSPDGRFVSVLRPGARPLDFDLVLVDVDTGETQIPLAHPDEPALIGPPAWVESSAFYASSNVGRDFSAIVRHDLVIGATTHLAGTGERFDAEVVASKDGGTIVVIENRGGVNALRRYDAAAGTAGREIPLPEPGIVQYFSFFSPPILSEDGRRLYYTLMTPRLGGDVFVHDLEADETRRLTNSPAAIGPEDLVSAERGEARSFDGEMIPFFVFRPASEEARPPTVVAVHGGPEAQAVLGFDPVIQALAAVGYGVVVPNVRGSTGYGKRYASLDDTTKRLDSVRDLEAVHGALADAGFDPDRAAVWGGSYGGYMVLSALAFQPELWAAGVDIVGISNLVTFLENTSEYRRAFREHEYGSLERDREFLAEASPLTHADAIRAPLFMIHGRNDPRVPVSEAEQLADLLARRGVRRELLIYEDEGHGLARLENELDAYPRAIGFLDEVLERG
jgi:acetyl esterase/lipase/Tol biopolymer transport system component